MIPIEKVKFCLRCGTALEDRIYEDGHLHPICPNCNWVFFSDPKVAAAVLITKDDRILLVQRTFDPMQGYWTLPAGYMNGGEHPEEAAARECLEETGLEVKITGLFKLIGGRDHPRGADIVLVYEGEIIGGVLQAQDDAAAAEYFSLDDLPPLAFRATKEAIAEFALKKK